MPRWPGRIVASLVLVGSLGGSGLSLAQQAPQPLPPQYRMQIPPGTPFPRGPYLDHCAQCRMAPNGRLQCECNAATQPPSWRVAELNTQACSEGQVGVRWQGPQPVLQCAPARAGRPTLAQALARRSPSVMSAQGSAAPAQGRAAAAAPVPTARPLSQVADLSWLASAPVAMDPQLPVDQLATSTVATTGVIEFDAGHRVPFITQGTAPGQRFVLFNLGNRQMRTLLPGLSSASPIDAWLPLTVPAVVVVADAAHQPMPQMSAPVQTWLASALGSQAGIASTLPIQQGFTLLTIAELDKIGLASVFEAFGLGSPQRLVAGTLSTRYAAQLLKGQAPGAGEAATWRTPVPEPKVLGDGTVPWLTFKDWVFELGIQNQKVQSQGVAGYVTAAVGGASLTLQASITEVMDRGKPVQTLTGEHAGTLSGFLGIPWLNVTNPKVVVQRQVDGRFYGFSGTVDLGGKTFDLIGGRALSAGQVTPVISFKARQPLDMQDMVRVANAMINASAGRGSTNVSAPIPVGAMPGLQMTDRYASSLGPTFRHVPKGATAPELGITQEGTYLEGALRVLGTNIGAATARFGSDGGLAVNASVSGMPRLTLGPATVGGPDVTVDVIAKPNEAPYVKFSDKNNGVNLTYTLYADSVAWDTKLDLFGGMIAGDVQLQQKLTGGATSFRLNASQSQLDRFKVVLAGGILQYAAVAKAEAQKATATIHGAAGQLTSVTQNIVAATNSEHALINAANTMEAAAKRAWDDAKSVVDDLCQTHHKWWGVFIEVACWPAREVMNLAESAYNAAAGQAKQMRSDAVAGFQQAFSSAKSVANQAAAQVTTTMPDLLKAEDDAIKGAAAAARMLAAGAANFPPSAVFEVDRLTVTGAYPVAASVDVTYDYKLFGIPGHGELALDPKRALPDLRAALAAADPGTALSDALPQSVKDFGKTAVSAADRNRALSATGQTIQQAVADLRPSAVCDAYPPNQLSQLEEARRRSDAYRQAFISQMAANQANLGMTSWLNLGGVLAQEQNALANVYGFGAEMDGWLALAEIPLSMCDPSYQPNPSRAAVAKRAMDAMTSAFANLQVYQTAAWDKNEVSRDAVLFAFLGRTDRTIYTTGANGRTGVCLTWVPRNGSKPERLGTLDTLRAEPDCPSLRQGVWNKRFYVRQVDTNQMQLVVHDNDGNDTCLSFGAGNQFFQESCDRPWTHFAYNAKWTGSISINGSVYGYGGRELCLTVRTNKAWDASNTMESPLEGRVQSPLAELWDCAGIQDKSTAQWLFVTPGTRELYHYWNLYSFVPPILPVIR